VALSVAELDLFSGFGGLLPAAAIVSLIKIYEKERMQEVHEPVSFV